MNKIPDFITHYYLKDKGPFRNMMDLDDSEFRSLIEELQERRKNDRDYNRRFANAEKTRRLRENTERVLREKFVLKGGHIKRHTPHYFCLGESKWFKHFCGHEEIRVPLSAIDPSVISFTYPDSVTSMGFLKDLGINHPVFPYRGQVFTLGELESIVQEYGMPQDEIPQDYNAYHRDDLEIYIEAQVWSDEPLRPFEARQVPTADTR